MCVPYIISDPPPRKRPRNSHPDLARKSQNSLKVQPAFVEISPRLTYISSPKPERASFPPKITLSAPKRRRSPEVEFLEGFAAGEKASRQEEGRAFKEEGKPAEAAASSTPLPGQPAAPPRSTTPAVSTGQQQQGLPLPPSEPVPPKHSPLPPPAPPECRPPPAPTLPHQNPFRRSTRSPHSYMRRPPPHYQDNRRSRSLSSDSTISRRSFERLKRNIHVLWERIRALEQWREEQERKARRGREVGPGRREGSLIRERRERCKGKEVERRDKFGERGRDEGRWDWEGGGLGRR